jgi:hypothetical protein
VQRRPDDAVSVTFIHVSDVGHVLVLWYMFPTL